MRHTSCHPSSSDLALNILQKSGFSSALVQDGTRPHLRCRCQQQRSVQGSIPAPEQHQGSARAWQAMAWRTFCAQVCAVHAVAALAPRRHTWWSESPAAGPRVTGRRWATIRQVPSCERDDTGARRAIAAADPAGQRRSTPGLAPAQRVRGRTCLQAAQCCAACCAVHAVPRVWAEMTADIINMPV